MMTDNPKLGSYKKGNHKKNLKGQPQGVAPTAALPLPQVAPRFNTMVCQRISSETPQCIL